MPEDPTPDPIQTDPTPTPDPAPADPPTPDPTDPPQPGTGEPEIDWKAKAREWEKRAKANQAEAKKNADAAKRIAEIEEAQKTAEQKAQDAAKAAEARAQAANQRVAKAEVKAALTGIVDDPESIIEDLNLSRYLTDDGDVDDDAVAALKTKYEALRPPSKRAPNPNPAQGANGGKEHEKPLTEADLKQMTTDEINKARREGRLDHLMGRAPRK